MFSLSFGAANAEGSIAYVNVYCSGSVYLFIFLFTSSIVFVYILCLMVKFRLFLFSGYITVLLFLFYFERKKRRLLARKLYIVFNLFLRKKNITLYFNDAVH